MLVIFETDGKINLSALKWHEKRGKKGKRKRERKMRGTEKERQTERGGKEKGVKGGQLPLVYVTASPSNGSPWVQMWCS